MMTIGLVTSVITTFTLLPSLINILTEKNIFSIKSNSDESKISNFLSLFSQSNKSLIYLFTIIVIVISAFGITKLKVENSFINYFDKDTEIHQGMKLIDNELGGTTPLEVILKFPKDEETELSNEEEDDWGEEEIDNEKYWFTSNKIEKIEIVHNYLENLEHVGKVLSFRSVLKVAEGLNNNKPLGSLEMGVLYTKLPENIKNEIVTPYISIENSEARISLRLKDANKDLRRNELINKKNYYLKNKLN